MLCSLLSYNLNLLVELGIELDIPIPCILFYGIYCNFNDSDKERALVEELASLKASREGHSAASKGTGIGFGLLSSI